jgi:glyoxylase-like metal-dependent hydrolase (beta-lactamase superfamily II)
MRAIKKGKGNLAYVQMEVVTSLRRDLKRILAPNPSPMTYWGTNTYLLGTNEVAVIDPGPADSTHFDRIFHQLAPGARVTHVLVTHAHLDHSEGALAFASRANAPVLAYGNAQTGRSAEMQALSETGLVGGSEGVDHAFAPDQSLADGEVVASQNWQLEAIWSPGHMGNHLCFAELQTGSMFTADLVMGWSTSLVSPPDGDLGAFFRSLERLEAHPANKIYYPGHGDPVCVPLDRVAELRAHRQLRHAQILAALREAPGSAHGLAGRIYTEVDPKLLPAATRNVLAHLIEMKAQSEATHDDILCETSIFRLI